MKHEVSKLEKNQSVITIEIEAAELDKALHKAYLKLAKDAAAPGFRKGKIPRFVLEQMIGKQALLDEAAEALMSPAYSEALSENNLEPVCPPELEIVTLEEGKDFVFKTTITLRPEIKFGEYKGIEIIEHKFPVADSAIERELIRIQDRTAKMIDVEDSVIEESDIAVIDYEGSVEGQLFDGGAAEDYSLTIGSGVFIPGFEEQVKGHKVGDSFDVNVTFPEEYHNENLKGKEAVFKVIVKGHKRREVLPLNDDFAVAMSEFDSLEGLKNSIIQRLEEGNARREREDIRMQAIEGLLATMDVDIPKVMVDEKIDSFLEEMNQRLTQQGLDVDKYMQYTGKTMDDLREETRENAEKAVQTELALTEIAKLESIDVSEDDIKAEIHKVAEMTNSEDDIVKDNLIKAGQFSTLVFTIVIQKSIDFLVENANIIKEEDVKAE